MARHLGPAGIHVALVIPCVRTVSDVEIGGNTLARNFESDTDRDGIFDELDESLRNALANPDRLCVQTIATFGRKLAEVVTA